MCLAAFLLELALQKRSSFSLNTLEREVRTGMKLPVCKDLKLDPKSPLSRATNDLPINPSIYFEVIATKLIQATKSKGEYLFDFVTGSESGPFRKKASQPRSFSHTGLPNQTN